jgi:hypothetical protein
MIKRAKLSALVRRFVSKVVRIALLFNDNSTTTVAIFTAVTHWNFSEWRILQANSSLYLQGLLGHWSPEVQFLTTFETDLRSFKIDGVEIMKTNHDSQNIYLYFLTGRTAPFPSYSSSSVQLELY